MNFYVYALQGLKLLEYCCAMYVTLKLLDFMLYFLFLIFRQLVENYSHGFSSNNLYAQRRWTQNIMFFCLYDDAFDNSDQGKVL